MRPLRCENAGVVSLMARGRQFLRSPSVDGGASPRLPRDMTSTRYEFFYWPSILGRGEFVRLALEQAGASYVDVARQPESKGGGVKALMQAMREAKGLSDLAPVVASPFGDSTLAAGATQQGAARQGEKSG